MKGTRALVRRILGRKPDACISFPKSGRTWLRVMLDALGADLRWLHAAAGHRMGLTADQLDTAWETQFDRIVFLHRNPIDTAVSGYHQATKRIGAYEGSIGDFIRDPRYGVEKVARYNAMWLDTLGRRDRAAIVTYESLQRDTANQVERLARFLRLDADRARIEDVVRACSFDAMKRDQRGGRFAARYRSKISPVDPAEPDSFKVRRGKIGGYRDELAPEDAAWAEALLERLAAAGVAWARDPASS